MTINEIVAWAKDIRTDFEPLLDETGRQIAYVHMNAVDERVVRFMCACCVAERPCPCCKGSCNECQDTGSTGPIGVFHEGGVEYPFAPINLIVDHATGAVIVEGCILLPGSGSKAPRRTRQQTLAAAYPDFTG